MSIRHHASCIVTVVRRYVSTRNGTVDFSRHVGRTAHSKVKYGGKQEIEKRGKRVHVVRIMVYVYTNIIFIHRRKSNIVTVARNKSFVFGHVFLVARGGKKNGSRVEGRVLTVEE